MAYIILDSETENHKSQKRKANPFDPRNYIVMRGWKVEGDTRCHAQRFDSQEAVTHFHVLDDYGSGDTLVGHNLKFDLLYELELERRNPGRMSAVRAFLGRGGRIWCTQLAEYLLHAQEQKYHMNALDGIVEAYGGRTKINGIKELWEAGVLTSEIDPDLLLDYLIGTEEEGRNSGDIGNTELVYCGQRRLIEGAGMLPSVLRRMDSLLATTEMEFNGLKVDIAAAKEDLKELTSELATVTEALEEFVSTIPEGVQFNWNSPVHVSSLLFGGTIKYSMQDTYIDPKTGELARKKATEAWPLFDKEPVDPATLKWRDLDGHQVAFRGTQQQDMYMSGKKRGQPKTKQVQVEGELKVKYQDFFYTLPGVTKPEPEWKSKLTGGVDGPVYSTNSDVVEILSLRDIPFLQTLGRFSALNKEIGTYYCRRDMKSGEITGMLACVNPQDNVVHHSLNHTSTVTSRLSSNNPNGQNIPKPPSKVKRMFVSRFGDNGSMIEIDYSQLEVVVQALLSKDKNLIADVCAGVDFHCKRVALKYSIPYEFALAACKDETHPEHATWKPRRGAAKNFSFQRAYGAGAKAISGKTGIPIEDVQKMIEVEEAAYPGVVKFNARVAAAVERSAEPFRDGQRGWREYRRGYWQSPTGAMYSWRSYDAPDYLRERGILENFKPTEMKNYPVQGTGGEIVQLIIGLLVRWFYKNYNWGGKALLVNTVHDCVWIDCHKSVLDEVTRGAVKIMQSVPQQLVRFFDMKCPVPFPVEAEVGLNMLELHHYQ